MKRPRPYIPLSVRIQVAERQFLERFPTIHSWALAVLRADTRTVYYLNWLLSHFEAPQLDHDPALVLRKFNPRTGKYTPEANDPEFLVYREKADHLQKTTGRAPGARRTVSNKGSDMGLRKKFARLERPKRRKATIPSRPFQKGSKFR